MKKRLLSTVVIALLLAFSITSCGFEYQYYHQNRRHSPEYNERHSRSHEGEKNRGNNKSHEGEKNRDNNDQH